MSHRNARIIPIHSKHSQDTTTVLLTAAGYAQRGLFIGGALLMLTADAKFRMLAGGLLAHQTERLNFGLSQYQHLLMLRAFNDEQK